MLESRENKNRMPYRDVTEVLNIYLAVLFLIFIVILYQQSVKIADIFKLLDFDQSINYTGRLSNILNN